MSVRASQLFAKRQSGSCPFWLSLDVCVSKVSSLRRAGRRSASCWQGLYSGSLFFENGEKARASTSTQVTPLIEPHTHVQIALVVVRVHHGESASCIESSSPPPRTPLPTNRRKKVFPKSNESYRWDSPAPPSPNSGHAASSITPWSCIPYRSPRLCVPAHMTQV